MIAVELGENIGISRDQSGWKERDEADAKAVMGQQLLDSKIGPSDGRTSELGLVTNGGLKFVKEHLESEENWGDKSPWMFGASWNMDSMVSHLLNLIRYLKIKPNQKVDFTPKELNSGKHVLQIEDDYGGDRTNGPRVISEHDVVWTTYGVLTAAYKSDVENNIYHRVDWYRVVLDEAHTIKSSKTVGARACFALSAHCRWCLTGTPLQNNLKDLYSLLCFFQVELWCNWTWWKTKIQRLYENGNPTGLKWIKAILRLHMFRRSKETKDKEGRSILVLPPTDIQMIECEQSEAECDFYDALFKGSKVQFDRFVAQGKVLHNYASILELLLRLRQSCNNPFLVMSRVDSQQYSNLNKLARRFLETHSDSIKAYIEEVVDGIRRGENTECPICSESTDDPVLTPCAHRMCREYLFSSGRTPVVGLGPIYRIVVKKSDIITCPTENKFRVDVENKWKESSKVSKLLECLERIRWSCSSEKSIVFSQWTSFLDLLEIPLKRRGIGFLRLDGKLVQKQREIVLKGFDDTREKMVLLMSLKAGG
ncbi:hypothetical protein V6N13_005031 [Hibiscus sabdariffa]